MPAIKLKKVTAEYLAEKEKKEAELKEQNKEKKKKSLEDVAAENEAAAGSGEGEKEDSADEKPSHNFLDVEILLDKRKRTLPKAEQSLIEWWVLDCINVHHEF